MNKGYRKSTLGIMTIIMVCILSGCNSEDNDIKPPEFKELGDYNNSVLKFMYDTRTMLVYVKSSTSGYFEYLSDNLNHYKYDIDKNEVYEIDSNGDRLADGDIIKAQEGSTDISSKKSSGGVEDLIH